MNTPSAREPDAPAEVEHSHASNLPASRERAGALIRRGLQHINKARVMFPLAAILSMGVLWGATLNLTRIELRNARHEAARSTLELGATYEAQVVRALREIDQTLKFVKYTYETENGRFSLDDLRDRGLLPPDLLFVVSIADRNGNLIDSTRAAAAANVDGEDYFEAARGGEAFGAGRPRQGRDAGESALTFSRRLNAPGGRFAGAVMITVGAPYFVSGYESSKLGNHGVLGLLGADGIFRVRRSGDSVFSGDAVDYARTVPDVDENTVEAPLMVNTWDGVRRYTSARALYDFPLAVIVGLSENEQLAATRELTRIYVLRATAASLVLLIIIAMLARLYVQLAQGRQRAVEEEVAHAARVEYLAYHDGLTGLANRSLFSKLLGQSITQSRRYKRQLAVLFIDLDRFKNINDTLGHDAGDALLKEIGTRLKSCLRESDTVARLGGDEFVVLLPELEDEKHIYRVAHKIIDAVARSFTLIGQDFRVTGSVGISVYPKDGEDEQTLMKNADIAMYQAKAEGKNNFQFYSEQLNANSFERLALESSLRRALEHDEFLLNYQAKRDLLTGGITGMEALIRWQHPDLGTVMPMQFIPIAEETGLIVAIGKWVLRTACAQNVAWQKSGLPLLSMAVNLSPRQFSDEKLLPDILSILQETGMDPTLLELEITEGTIMHNIERTLKILTELTNKGIRIAIDDFGTGYSSLSTLKQIPVDTIKIDRSFVHDIITSAEDRGITRAIIAMGKTLSMTVVAEGVETQEQAEFLRANACDEFQGFYFSKPVAADEFAQLLRGHPARTDGENEKMADIV